MALFKQLGVEAVVKGAAAFNKSVDEIQAKVDKTASSLQKAAEKSGAFDKAAASAGQSAKGFGAGLDLSAVKSLALEGAVGTLAAAVGVATAAIAAGSAALGAFIALAERGKGLNGIIDGYTVLQTTIKGNTNVIEGLRKAAKGTMDDIDLMRQANMALMGTDAKFAEQMAKALPKLLEIARTQAKVTGQDTAEIFDRLIMAVKAAQARMLTSSGIIVKNTFAFEQYAASIGKSAAELTLEEQQLATLNSVLQEGGNILALYGNIAETAGTKQKRLAVHIGEALDALALAVQPAFRKILDTLEPIYAFLEKFAIAAAPYLAAIANAFAGLFEKILGPIGKAAKALNAGEVAKRFFEGGARLMGSLAGGIAQGAHAVLTVVKQVAQAIANFLIGFSPPKEGPLSMIDVGGANVLKAWLEGFMGVGLDPVEQVAAEVSALMGSIGSATQPEVEARLAALDAALKPFQDRLTLISAQFNALKGPVDAAFSAIDRQMEKALVALNRGAEGSAATVRQLDRQKEALQEYVDMQQAQVDAASVQLALAQAAQAQERAALEIRKQMFGTTSPLANNLVAGTVPAEAAATTPAAAAASTVAAGVSDAVAQAGLQAVTDAAATFNADIAEAGKDMSNAFTQGFTSAGGVGMDVLKQDVADINKAGTNITKGWDNFGKKISGIATTIGDNLSAAWDIIKKNAEKAWSDLVKNVEDIWTGLQLNLGETLLNIKNNIETSWSSVQTWLTNTIGDIQTGIESAWSNIQIWLTNTIGNIQTTISNAWNNITLNISMAVGLAVLAITLAWNNIVNFVNGIVGQIRAAFDNVARAITGALQPAVDFINNLSATLNRLPGVQGNQGSIASSLFGFIGPLANLFRASGGPFQGAAIVGEQGPELVTSSRTAYVISNQVASVVAGLSSAMARPAPMPAYAGWNSSTVYNQQRNMGDVVFNNVAGTNDAMRRYAVLRALGRVR